MQQTVNIWISDIRARQRVGREIIIIRLYRLGWTQEQIAEMVDLSRNRISEIVGNANFGEIDTLLSQGQEMDYIARHYHMDLALAWAPCVCQENATRKSSKSLAGDFAPGINGILMNVMNALGMICQGKSQPRE